jgi:hypothetical protein
MGGKLLNFEGKLRERLIDGCMQQFGAMNEQASEIADSYLKLMMEDSALAIKQMNTFIGRTRDVNLERALGEAMVGPNQDWTAPMLDILGIVYPSLEKDVRKEGLKKCFKFLDGLRYDYSQSNVELINEPWLVADIVINRSLYWCGYKEYALLLGKNRTWKELEPNLEITKSAFWLAIAVTRPKYSSLEVRTRFYEKFPDLMDRTQDAIAAVTYVFGLKINEGEGTSIEEYIDTELLKYDPLLHQNIKSKIKKGKWVLLEEN